jgi:hypothetical protein
MQIKTDVFIYQNKAINEGKQDLNSMYHSWIANGCDGDTALSENVANSCDGDTALSEHVANSCDGDTALSEHVANSCDGDTALSEHVAKVRSRTLTAVM